MAQARGSTWRDRGEIHGKLRRYANNPNSSVADLVTDLFTRWEPASLLGAILDRLSTLTKEDLDRKEIGNGDEGYRTPNARRIVKVVVEVASRLDGEANPILAKFAERMIEEQRRAFPKDREAPDRVLKMLVEAWTKGLGQDAVEGMRPVVEKYPNDITPLHNLISSVPGAPRRETATGGGGKAAKQSGRKRVEDDIEVVHGLLADYLDGKVGLVACLDRLKKYDPDELLPVVLSRQYAYAIEDFDAPGYPPPKRDLADTKMGRLGHVVNAIATSLGDEASFHFVNFGSFLVKENARMGRGWRASAVAHMAVYFNAEALRSLGSEELHQAVLCDIARSAPNGDPGFILRPRAVPAGALEVPGAPPPDAVSVFLVDGRDGYLSHARWRPRAASATVDLCALIFDPQGIPLGDPKGTVVGSVERTEPSRWRFRSMKVPSAIEDAAGDSTTAEGAHDELLKAVEKHAPRIRDVARWTVTFEMPNHPPVVHDIQTLPKAGDEVVNVFDHHRRKVRRVVFHYGSDDIILVELSNAIAPEGAFNPLYGPRSTR